MLNSLVKKIKTISLKKYLSENTTVGQQILINQYKSSESLPLLIHEVGFSVFSQHEEDGILLYIFALIGTTNKTCIEMCCGTAIESNTANLIINHFWTGLLFDGVKKNIEKAKELYSFHKNSQIYPPKLECAWITKDNVNDLIKNAGISGEIDLFSLDMDGVDLYVLENLEVVSPRVIVVEINHLWGWGKSVSIPYHTDFKAIFTKDGSDYAGASLAAFIKISKMKGYRFVGTNRFATNAFFIRNDVGIERIPEETNLSKYFTHPRVVYGMTERYARVKDLEWNQI